MRSITLSIKKAIRRIALKSVALTAKWVVGEDIWYDIERCNLPAAQRGLDYATRLWGRDPEIQRAQESIELLDIHLTGLRTF